MPTLEPQHARQAGPSEIMRAYKRMVYWSRLAVAAFAFVCALTLIYAMPWLGLGLDMSDYNSANLSLMFLIFCTSIAAFFVVYLRDSRRRVEQVISTFGGGPGEVRHRESFYDRIVLECQRARASNAEFTVAVLRLQGDKELLPEADLTKVLNALVPLFEDADCISTISHHEIGVLAPGVRALEAEAYGRSILSVASAALPTGRPASVRAGFATYGRDATDAGDLVAFARLNLTQIGTNTPAETEVTLSKSA